MESSLTGSITQSVNLVSQPELYRSKKGGQCRTEISGVLIDNGVLTGVLERVDTQRQSRLFKIGKNLVMMRRRKHGLQDEGRINCQYPKLQQYREGSK